jgi:hypothetical protein
MDAGFSGNKFNVINIKNCKKIMNLFKEPLLHFLLIGAALFLLFDWRGNSAPVAGGAAGTPAVQITLRRDAIEQIKGQFVKTWQREPTEEEQKELVEDLVRNEIFYREAIAIGLDRDDEVLKRRLRQKMEFIYEDISSWVEPSDADLRAYMNNHKEKYLTDPRLSFRQVLISKDKRGKNAESDARQILGKLKAGADPDTLGDTTLLEAEVRLSPLWDISKQFGEEFGTRLLDLKPGTWGGPVRSAYGLHLVFVKERQYHRLPAVNEVRNMVKQDWLVDKQKELKNAAYAKIRERYTVTVEKPRGTVAPLSIEVDLKVKVQ